MLSKDRRIPREFFEEVIKQGKNIHSESVYLKYVKKNNNKSLFSFVISSKISKKATERNLFKRRCRHIIKKTEDKVLNGFICAFFAKKGVTKITFSQLEKEILALINKAGVVV